MGILDEAFQQIASTLIGAFSDVPATYRRQPLPRYDESTGRELVFEPTLYSVKITPPVPYHKRQINGTSVKASDLHCYVAAKDLPLTPETLTDSLTWLSSTFMIVASTPVGTADGNVMTELQLRQ